MSRSVVVVGAGIAGLAAAWSARRAGAEVTIVFDRAGASALGSGAVDDVPWEAVRPGVASELEADEQAFTDALDLWRVPARRRALLATLAGRVRPARGADRALLDLTDVAEGIVLLPRADRPGWDADALAPAFSAEDGARAQGLRFVVADVPLHRLEGESRLGDAVFAARHDDPARLAWLAARLKPEVDRTRANAVLLGPWLGVAAPRARALSEALGVPAGEALVGAGSPAGLRFEAARDALLDRIGVGVVHARVRRLDDGPSPTVTTDAERELRADAIVVATGGVVGGGVSYDPPEHASGPHFPARGRSAFALSFELVRGATDGAGGVPARIPLAERGRLMGVASSLAGPELDTSAWPSHGRAGLLERVGLASDGPRLGDATFVAGDAMADCPRTVLEALRSGLAAGRAAAR